MGLIQDASSEQARRIYDLSNPADVALIGYFGAGLDSETEPGTGLLVQAVKERWPNTCSDDALDSVGGTMQILRFPGESHDAYRGRLKVAFDTHSWGGTAVGIADYSLEPYCVALGATAPVVTVLEDWQGPFAPWTGGWYSRFLVVIQGSPWTGLALDSADAVLDDCTLGSTASVAEIAQVKRQILRIKDAHGLPVKVRAVLDGGPLLDIDAILDSSTLSDTGGAVDWPLVLLLDGGAALDGMPLGTYIL
jgi:hypothetical protein